MAAQSLLPNPDGGVILHVRVQPKASRNAFSVEPDGRIRVALTAPPVDGEANDALKAFIAKSLGVPKRAVSLLKGEKSREKTIAVADIDLATAQRALGFPNG